MNRYVVMDKVFHNHDFYFFLGGGGGGGGF